MNPEKVDVNVHPAKLEVRFEEDNKVFKAIYHAIKEALLKGDLVGNPDRTDELREETLLNNKTNNGVELNNNFLAQIYAERQNLKNNENIVKENKKDLNIENEEILDNIENRQIAKVEENTQKENNTASNENTTIVNNIKELDNMETKTIDTNEVNQKFIENIKKLDKLPEIMAKEEPKTELEKKLSFDEMYERTFGRKIEEAQAEKLKEEQEEYNSSLGKVASDFKQISKVENVSVFKELEKNETPLYKFIGIAFSTYIITKMKDDMYIIDQHAAHERIMYERVLNWQTIIMIKKKIHN